MEEVALISDIDQFDQDADAVVLMTVHSAKGLEFENVYLVGWEEGIFPGNQSIYGTPEDIEEERRLAYVAITRAKKRLMISNAYTRMLFGQTSRNLPSRFLDEVPKELCNIKSVRGGMSSFGMGSADYRYSDGRGNTAYSFGSDSYSRPKYDDGFFGSRPTQGVGLSYGKSGGTLLEKSKMSSAKGSVTKATFTVGQRVKHKVFGPGMIISAKPMGNDTLLEIAFDEKGTKKLMANFAKLENI